MPASMPSAWSRLGLYIRVLFSLAFLAAVPSAQAATPKSNSLGTAKAEAALAFDPYSLSASPKASSTAGYVLVRSISAAGSAAAAASPLNPNQVQFSIGDVSVSLPASGGTSATFTVSLSAPCNQQLTIAYTTKDGTAKAGTDYVSKSGSLTFPTGSQSQTFTVSILSSSPAKTNTFSAIISQSSNGSTIARSTGVGTIVPAVVAKPTISVFGVNTNEGTQNHTVFVQVALTAPLAVDEVFTFKTTQGGKSPFAEAGGVDYNSVPLTQLTIKKGQTSISVPVTITGGSKLPRTTTKPVKGTSIYFRADIAVVSGTAQILAGNAPIKILYDK